jgi:hypothetical protein
MDNSGVLVIIGGLQVKRYGPARAVMVRQGPVGTHNPKVTGSNPVPATIRRRRPGNPGLLLLGDELNL